MKFTKDEIPLFLLILWAAVLAFLTWSIVSEFIQMPSPIYGGDLYFQLGSVYHMYETSPVEWFSSSSIEGPRSAYFPVYGIIVTVFGKILGLEPMDAMFYLSVILPAVSLILWFLLFLMIFRSRWIALIGSAIYVGMPWPILKYTYFTEFIVLPVFLYTLYLFFKEQSLKNAVFLGIMIGIFSLSHGVGFVVSFFMTGFVIAYLFAKSFLKEGKFVRESGVDYLKKNILTFLLVFVIGFAMAMVWWFEPIFVYHGATQSRASEWAVSDITEITNQIDFTYKTLGKRFFNFSDIFTAIWGIISILGVLIVLGIRKKGLDIEGNEFIKATLIGGAILTFSFFITIPVMDMSLFPKYLVRFAFTPIVFMAALVFIENLRKNIDEKKFFAVLAIIAAVWLLYFFGSYETLKEDQWILVAQKELSPHLLQAQTYILGNTDVYDVFISSKENAFMINALTGRKVLTLRRGHMEHFVEVDPREVALAVILYGNDDSKRIELLREYNVSYLYWDVYWINSEFTIQDGQVVGWFDPILVYDTPENRKMFDENGVKYTVMNTWIDPSVKGEDVPMFDVLIVGPENYEVFDHPWNSGLDPYLEKIWQYDEGGLTYVAVYKVNA